MRVGVGYSEHGDSRMAGIEAVSTALSGLPPASSCDLVMIFSTAQHDPAALHAGVRSMVGPSPRLIGGWSVGAITNNCLGYGGLQVGIAVFHFETVQWAILAEGNLARDQEAAGHRLGESLRALPLDNDAAVIMLYDSVDRTSGRMKLNMATPILNGVHTAMNGFPHLVGAGLCGDMTGRPTWQWIDDDLRQQTVFALVLWGGIRMDSVIMHGCMPATGYRTITKADGAVIHEIDHRPALEVIAELLGDSGISPKEYGFFVTLGRNMGEKWDEPDETAYVNRMCLKANEETGSLIMFEPDLVQGCEVQLMHRSVTFDYIAPKIDALFEAAAARRPLFALYINCAGRAAAYSGLDGEDGAVVQDAVAGRVPLLGFYSGVEIAPVRGRPQPLDWTGVFCLFSLPA